MRSRSRVRPTSTSGNSNSVLDPVWTRMYAIFPDSCRAKPSTSESPKPFWGGRGIPLPLSSTEILASLELLISLKVTRICPPALPKAYLMQFVTSSLTIKPAGTARSKELLHWRHRRQCSRRDDGDRCSHTAPADNRRHLRCSTRHRSKAGHAQGLWPEPARSLIRVSLASPRTLPRDGRSEIPRPSPFRHRGSRTAAPMPEQR